MEVISLINMKGGVGKTTTTHNLAGALAIAGRRVIAVDNDPQSSLSQGLLGRQAGRGTHRGRERHPSSQKAAWRRPNRR